MICRQWPLCKHKWNNVPQNRHLLSLWHHNILPDIKIGLFSCQFQGGQWQVILILNGPALTGRCMQYGPALMSLYAIWTSPYESMQYGPALTSRCMQYEPILTSQCMQYGPALTSQCMQYGPALTSRCMQYGPTLTSLYAIWTSPHKSVCNMDQPSQVGVWNMDQPSRVRVCNMDQPSRVYALWTSPHKSVCNMDQSLQVCMQYGPALTSLCIMDQPSRVCLQYGPALMSLCNMDQPSWVCCQQLPYLTILKHFHLRESSQANRCKEVNCKSGVARVVTWKYTFKVGLKSSEKTATSKYIYSHFLQVGLTVFFIYQSTAIKVMEV